MGEFTVRLSPARTGHGCKKGSCLHAGAHCSAVRSMSSREPMQIGPLAPAALATLRARHLRASASPRSTSTTRSSRRAPSCITPGMPDASVSSSCSDAACPRRGRTSSPHERCSPSASATSPPRPTSIASQ
jgi:hypothetical protein